MTLDNRIRLPASKIDFSNDVGLSSQDHDDYPPPGGQARFDHMRSFLIGLLSLQSSMQEPTQYREGTPWYDLNTSSLKIRRQGVWVPIAEVITVEDEITLSDWYDNVSRSLGNLAPEISYSGISTADNIVNITIPVSLRAYLYSDSRPYVYKNGLLLDPRNARLDPSSNPVTITLTGGDRLMADDEFTVIIRRIPATTWYVPNVSVP